MKTCLRFSAFLLMLSFLVCASYPALAQDSESERNFLEGLTLVTLETDDVMSLQKARKHIQDLGGTVAILSPPNLIMGWIDRDLEPQLVGEANIRSVHYDTVLPYEIEAEDVVSRGMVNWFNRAVSGDYERQIHSELAKTPAKGWPSTGDGDAFPTPGLDIQAYEQNLRDQGYDVSMLRDQGLLKTVAKGNSDAMSGTVAVQLFFVESDGSGADPDLYTWTDQAVQDYIAGVNTGLAWWSLKATEYRDCWAAFLVRWTDPTDPRVNQWREMVNHPSGDVAAMASEIMDNFGYTSGNVFSQVEAYNTAQCLTYGTDRSYSAFIAYNPLGSPDRLTDGRSAFAYLLGPYTFLLYRSYGWQPDQVFTHESGHIFGACDEYSNGCACAGPCTNGVPNYNCEDCGNNRLCMMDANSFLLCQHTDAHVGWRLGASCAPPPLAPPVLTSISPSTGDAGQTFDVTITGDNLVWGADLDLGEFITVNSATVLDANTMTANITVESLASPGLRSASITNRDLQVDELFDAFAVIPSLRHYLSDSGSNEFPYTTPATAAATFNDVLQAAAAGDSVLVSTGSFSTFEILVERPLNLYGGYSSGFTTRDKVLQRTSLEITAGILATADALFDGFEIFGGEGTTEYLPDEAHFGGAIAIRNSTLTLNDCEIRDNLAVNLPTGLSAGGAVHARDAVVDIRNTIFRSNRSYTGGALHLERTSGVVEGNSFVTNTADDQFAGAHLGGAIFAEDCTGLTLRDNLFDQNASGLNGGAVYVKDSTGIVVEGGSFVGNQSSGGSGVYAIGSDVVVTGVPFSGNSTTASGGGVFSDTGSTLQVTGSTFSGNTALLGAGVYAAGSSITVDHSLFTQNSATAAGAAIYLNSPTGGAIEANTFDGNTHPSPASAAVLLVSAPVEFRHNLLTNNNGVGVLCTGAPGATTGVNLGWNNVGGDFDGCLPTTGWILADPLYVDAAGGDFHLALHSPAIDAADPDPAFADVDGSRGDLGRFGAGSLVFDQPSRPTALTGASQAADVQLQWAASGEPDVVTYVVYASDTLPFAPSVATQVAQVAAPTTQATLPAITGTTHYVVSAVDAQSYASGYSDALTLEPGATAVGDTPGPRFTRLARNQPNPFNPRTVISYDIAQRGRVKLAIFDVTGRRVAELFSGEKEVGSYEAIWEGRDGDGHRVPSGVYFYRLVAPGFEQTQKMTLLK